MSWCSFLRPVLHVGGLAATLVSRIPDEQEDHHRGQYHGVHNENHLGVAAAAKQYDKGDQHRNGCQEHSTAGAPENKGEPGQEGPACRRCFTIWIPVHWSRLSMRSILSHHSAVQVTSRAQRRTNSGPLGHSVLDRENETRGSIASMVRV